jgi:hypothetical protein
MYVPHPEIPWFLDMIGINQNRLGTLKGSGVSDNLLDI